MGREAEMSEIKGAGGDCRLGSDGKDVGEECGLSAQVDLFASLFFCMLLLHYYSYLSCRAL